jgi:hypothetical protein
LNGCDREDLLSNLHRVAKRVTKEADTKLDRSGKKVTEESEVDYGDNVLIVDADHEQNLITHLEKADPQKKLF